MARAVELGVASQGRTVEEAEFNVREAVSLYLEDTTPSKKEFSYRTPIVISSEVEYA